MKKILFLLLGVILFCSCADNKEFTLKDNTTVTVEPYGLLNKGEKFNEQTVYELCIPNIVLDVLFCETIIVPAILVSTQLYEPVSYNDTLK